VQGTISIRLFVLLIGGFLLHGCGVVSKQQFMNESISLSNKKVIDINIPKSKNEYINIEYDKYARKILKDSNITSAIYDEALIENKAWSVDSIYNSDWHYNLIKRGLVTLNDDDKVLVLKLFSEVFSTATPPECTDLKKNLNTVYRYINLKETDKLMQLLYATLTSGAMSKKTDENREESKKDFFIGFVALTSKAKDALPDKELGDLVYGVFEKTKTQKGIECVAISKLLDLAQMIEPKYRDYLFKYLYVW